MTTPSYSFRRAEEASNATGPIVAPGYTRTDAPVPVAAPAPTQTSAPTFSPTSPSTYVGGTPVYIPEPTPAPVATPINTGTENYGGLAGAGQAGGGGEPVATSINTGAGNYGGLGGAGQAGGGGAPVTSTADKSTDKVIALDTFRNTLALFFGKDEVQKPWVIALYNVASKYYNTGSTIDESINLSVQDARNNPELKTFADRFGGIYALQDRLVKGEAIQVPTVAEYFKSESAMGDVLRRAGMGEVATQQFLGTVLGLGKSVIEVTNLINDTFNSIDNAPSALKKDLDSILNLGVSRTDIAKALLMGKEGAAELNKKISGISTLSAAKSQGVTIDMATASDLAMGGADYNKSLAGFADVKRLERGQALGRMSGIDFAQSDAIAAQFQSNVVAQDKIAKIVEGEGARFSGKTGRLQSQNRAQGLI
jgi:hypothetical protein